MPIEFDIDQRAGIVVMTMSGQLTAADFLDYFAALEADPRFDESLARLIISTDATGYPPPKDVAGVVERMRRRTAARPPRFAIVADTPMAIGMANMFMGQSGLSHRFQLFPDRESATRWLASPAADAEPRNPRAGDS